MADKSKLGKVVSLGGPANSNTEVESASASSEEFQIELSQDLKDSIYDLKDDLAPEEIADMFEVQVELVQSYLKKLEEEEQIS